MIELEGLIYALGAMVIILVEMATILSLVYLICTRLVIQMYKKLRSVYRHTQLLFFMRRLESKGVKALYSEAKREGYQIEEPES